MSLVSLSLKTGRFIFIWAPSSQCLLPHLECPDPSNLSDLDDTDKVVNNELLSLSNPWSREGNGNQDSGDLWSLQHLLQSWPLGTNVAMVNCQSQPPWGCFREESPVQSNLKGCWVNRFKHGHPGPLTFTWWSVKAWAISC